MVHLYRPITVTSHDLRLRFDASCYREGLQRAQSADVLVSAFEDQLNFLNTHAITKRTLDADRNTGLVILMDPLVHGAVRYNDADVLG
jgi:hypothetical protein